jgi:transposase
MATTDTPITPLRPPEPARRQLTCDQRRDIRPMNSLGYDHELIAAQLRPDVSLRQIQYTVETERATPRKRCGRPPKLSTAQVDALVAFVRRDSTTRRMTYQQLADALDFNVTADTIRFALRSRGYHRRVALRKPPLSDENKRIRLRWASEHVH